MKRRKYRRNVPGASRSRSFFGRFVNIRSRVLVSPNQAKRYIFSLDGEHVDTRFVRTYVRREDGAQRAKPSAAERRRRRPTRRFRTPRSCAQLHSGPSERRWWWVSRAQLRSQYPPCLVSFHAITRVHSCACVCARSRGGESEEKGRPVVARQWCVACGVARRAGGR